MTKPTPYLTPDQLQITPAEHAYLIRALEILERMETGVHYTIPGDGEWLFNMAVVHEFTECGTAGCILGLCERLVEIDDQDCATAHAPFSHGSVTIDGEIMAYSPVLLNLFYPDLVSLRAVTPQDAARATRKFLETGVIHFEGHQRWPRGA